MKANVFERILQRSANTVTLLRGRDGEAVQTHAFLQRVRGRQAKPPLSPKNLGAVDARSWVYIGPAQYTLRMGDRVICDGAEYEVQDSERICLGGEPTHVWALLRTMPEVYP